MAGHSVTADPCIVNNTLRHRHEWRSNRLIRNPSGGKNMILNNIRLAFRSLRQRPGLSAVVTAMLGLGFGANTALFSLFHQILMQPLNVPGPQRLVNLISTGPKFGSTSCGLAGGCKYVFSYRMFRDLEARQTAFTGIAAYRDFRANVGYREQTVSAGAMLISGRYFPVPGLPSRSRAIDRTPGRTASRGVRRRCDRSVMSTGKADSAVIRMSSRA